MLAFLARVFEMWCDSHQSEGRKNFWIFRVQVWQDDDTLRILSPINRRHISTINIDFSNRKHLHSFCCRMKKKIVWQNVYRWNSKQCEYLHLFVSSSNNNNNHAMIVGRIYKLRYIDKWDSIDAMKIQAKHPATPLANGQKHDRIINNVLCTGDR